MIAKGSRCRNCQRRINAPKNARRAGSQGTVQRLKRDIGACQVCGSTDRLEVHHRRALKDGGSHDPSNLIVLCHAHHQAVHRGQ